MEQYLLLLLALFGGTELLLQGGLGEDERNVDSACVLRYSARNVRYLLSEVLVAPLHDAALIDPLVVAEGQGEMMSQCAQHTSTDAPKTDTPMSTMKKRNESGHDAGAAHHSHTVQHIATATQRNRRSLPVLPTVVVNKVKGLGARRRKIRAALDLEDLLEAV